MRNESVETGGTVKERIREALDPLGEGAENEDLAVRMFNPIAAGAIYRDLCRDALAEIERLEGVIADVVRKVEALRKEAEELDDPWSGLPTHEANVEAGRHSAFAEVVRVLDEHGLRALSDSKGGA